MMTSKDYGVEVIRAYEFKRVGQVFYPTGLMRDRLISCGFVKRRKPDDEKPEVTSVNQKKPKLRLK